MHGTCDVDSGIVSVMGTHLVNQRVNVYLSNVDVSSLDKAWFLKGFR